MRHTTLLFLLLAGALSVALFSVKYQVQDLEGELVDLNRMIIKERQSIHVLNAEWSHLNNPERLGNLAGRYLDMKPADPANMTSFENIGLMNIDYRGKAKEYPDLLISTSVGDAQVKSNGEGRGTP